MKKKVGLIGLLSLFIISLPSVLAQDMLSNVWKRIIGIGNLGFLGISDGSLVAGFVRILVGILIFAIFFALFKSGHIPDFLRKQATIISLILAIISAVFMPAGVLLGIGSGWGIAVAFLLVGAPLVGIVYLLWKIPWEGEETRFSVFIKLMLNLLLFWILSAMKYHTEKVLLGNVGGVVTDSINQFLDWALLIVTILIIYYIIKLIIAKPMKEEKGKAEEAEKGREKLKKFIGEKKKAAKTKKEKEAVRKKLDPVKGLLINCINAAEEGVTHLKAGTKEEAEKAREQLEKFNKNIKIAWRELRKLRDKAEGEEEAVLEKLAVHAHQLVNTIKEKKLTEYKVSKPLEKKNVEAISLYLQRFRLVCGVMIKGLDNLMK